MSFLIAVYVNEGIVLASDRRTTYSSIQSAGNTIYRNFGIHVTNSTDKTFICPNGAGISTCGDSSILGKPITGYICEVEEAEESSFGLCYIPENRIQGLEAGQEGIEEIRFGYCICRN